MSIKSGNLMQRILSFLLVCVFLSTPVPARPAQANVEYPCTEVSEIPAQECDALVALYNSTNGPAWSDSTNWLVTLTPSDWYGVIVDISGHVTELNLDANGLIGPLPSALKDLTNLTRLSLHSNQLTGPIPPELSTLSQLRYLYLYGNALEGFIPPELGGLANLWSLWLSGNQLSGSIPSELGQLTALAILRLAGNQLTGELPAEMALMTGLEQLSLGNNQFTGEIPSWLGSLSNLTILSLVGNQLSGSIPPELGALSGLYELELSSNQLNGTIPAELGELPNLYLLRLEKNQLIGDIPESFANLVNILPPGDLEDGSDGLDLDYNWLNVPEGYPEPGNSLHDFLSQYDPDWHTRQAFEQVIGSAGGEFTSLDGRAHFVIPEAALAGDTTFTFIPLPALNHDPGELAYANHSFQLTAEDALGQAVTEFVSPLIVTLAYNEADILGINEYSLTLHYWDSGSLAWLDAITTCDGAAYSRDALANTFSLPLCHLSDFAVFGAPLQYLFLPFVVR